MSTFSPAGSAGRTAFGEVQQRAGVGVTVGELQRGRQLGHDTVGATYLPDFGCDGHRGADDEQVVDDPGGADQNRADFTDRTGEQAPDGESETGHVQGRQNQVGRAMRQSN